MDAVISFPKSGRTWLRVMLDQLGIDVEYRHAGASHAAARTIDTLDTSAAADYERIVFLYRDPRDTAISGYHQKKKRRGGYSGGISDFIRSPNHGVEKIIHFNRMWLDKAENDARIFTISYEEMKADTVDALSRTASFLGCEVTRDRICEVVEDNQFKKMQKKERSGEYAEKYGAKLTPRKWWDFNSYKVRRGIVGGYRDELSKKDVEWCDKLVAEFQDRTSA